MEGLSSIIKKDLYIDIRNNKYTGKKEKRSKIYSYFKLTVSRKDLFRKRILLNGVKNKKIRILF